MEVPVDVVIAIVETAGLVLVGLISGVLGGRAWERRNGRTPDAAARTNGLHDRMAAGFKELLDEYRATHADDKERIDALSEEVHGLREQINLLTTHVEALEAQLALNGIAPPPRPLAKKVS